MADTCDTTTTLGLRNRALLLVGFDAALRRSELVRIDVAHLQRRTGQGITIELPHSKSDQKGEGATVSILARPDSPWCPVDALERWLRTANRRAGPVFVGLRRSRYCTAPGEQQLSEHAVARIVKQAAERAGLKGDLSRHSLRRGMITTAIDAGVAPMVVQAHVRHAKVDTSLQYAETQQSLARHPGTGLHADDEQEQLPQDTHKTIRRRPMANGPGVSLNDQRARTMAVCSQATKMRRSTTRIHPRTDPQMIHIDSQSRLIAQLSICQSSVDEYLQTFNDVTLDDLIGCNGRILATLDDNERAMLFSVSETSRNHGYLV